jgi:hypothetical protein
VLCSPIAKRSKREREKEPGLGNSFCLPGFPKNQLLAQSSFNSFSLFKLLVLFLKPTNPILKLTDENCFTVYTLCHFSFIGL